MSATSSVCKRVLRLDCRLLTLALLLVSGCPKRFDPRAETLPRSGDASQERDYQGAKARLDAGDARGAESGFIALLERHPSDALAQAARLGAARAALRLGEAGRAKALLEPMARGAAAGEDPNSPGQHARYLLGLALHQTGEFARSRDLLRPFSASIRDGEEAIALHAVLGDDAAHLGNVDEALAEYSIFFESATPAERVYLRDRAKELVERLAPGEALKLWNRAQADSLSFAFLGQRVASDLLARGEAAAAEQVLEASRRARERTGMEEPARARREAPPRRAIGLVLPVSGKSHTLGERALRGALLADGLLAAGQLDGGPVIDLEVRDSGSDAARATPLVRELGRQGVAILIGSPDRLESSMVEAEARAIGLLLLELAPANGRSSEVVFRLIRPVAARARALAARALQDGNRTVAILAPDSGYGRSMAQAFTEALRSGGGTVVAELHYPETATTFIQAVKQVSVLRPDALFIPAAAAQLELIASHLAAAGVTNMVGVRARAKTARLYASADGLSDRILNASAKYLMGAVLAPVFAPDHSNERVATFIERYQRAYGEEPSTLDALSYDAVRAARVALQHLAPGASRAEVAAAVRQLREAGVTGEIAFTASGERAGRVPLYTIDAGTLRALN